jgi:hypothetical protein
MQGEALALASQVVPPHTNLCRTPTKDYREVPIFTKAKATTHNIFRHLFGRQFVFGTLIIMATVLALEKEPDSGRAVAHSTHQESSNYPRKGLNAYRG